MNIAEKVLRQKKDFDDVYNAGKKAEYDVLWDGIQDYGNRTDYTQGFKNWNSVETITPKYPIRAINLSELFYQCKKLKSVPMIGCANADGKFQTCYCAFYQCYSLTSVDFDIANSSTSQSAWQYTFQVCSKLRIIKKIIVMENQVFTGTFQSCMSLENLTIEGTIGQNGFNVQWSTKLTHESLMSIINALKDYSADTSGTEWIVTIGSENKTKLTEAELNIAKNKGWQVN